MASENWDQYFLSVAEAVASNSHCLSRKIGAVLVQDKSIVCTGYNGPPRGVPHCYELDAYDMYFASQFAKRVFNGGDFFERVVVGGECPRRVIGYESGKGLDICPAGHAERNALINAARHGIKTYGGTLYMTCNIPCKDCLIEIINAGVAEVVVRQLSYYDELSVGLVRSSGIKIRVYDV